MRTGGFRRLYIPGELAFPQGLKAAAGRPSVPAKSPVIFDVKLLLVPGGCHDCAGARGSGAFTWARACARLRALTVALAPTAGMEDEE